MQLRSLIEKTAYADFLNETIGFAANRALADPPAPAWRQARRLGCPMRGQWPPPPWCSVPRGSGVASFHALHARRRRRL